MNKRIYKKVYKRADKKLHNYIEQNGEKRTTLEVAKEEHILSTLEKRVFLKAHERQMKLFEEIKSELIAEGKW